jgi:WD40 repeat protein
LLEQSPARGIPQSQQRIGVAADRTVRIWDVASGRTIHTLRGHEDAVYALAYVGEGLLVSGGWDQRLALWDTATGAQLHEWTAGPDQWVGTLAASRAAPLLASAGLGGGVKLWEM